MLALSANGLVPKELLLSNITADANSLPSTQNGTDVAILYRLLQASPYYPRAELISEPTQNNQTIWTWTIAPTISAVTNNNMLDISVTFPAEETHYMLIRGIRPAFMRIELYNMNYRTDPAFESYNSSGWSYNVADQTLLLKMRHRSEVEHVKIFW